MVYLSVFVVRNSCRPSLLWQNGRSVVQENLLHTKS